MLASPNDEQLTPTARAILGYLSLQPRSGYEIRQAASRNLAWGMSDGQIYPQLRQLDRRGLIESWGPPSDARGRQRWRLTDEGHAALRAWVQSEQDQLIVRDENLVKLLFADQFGKDALLDLLSRRRSTFVGLKEALGEITPGTHRVPSDQDVGRLGPSLVHSYGLDFAETNIAWCDRTIRMIQKEHDDYNRLHS